jgi:hypothetical protein
MKSETRNPKSETSSKGGKRKEFETAGLGSVLNLWAWAFGFVSDFGFRISDFTSPTPYED